MWSIGAQALGLAITGEFPHFPVNPVWGLAEPNGSMSPCPDLQQVKEIMESYDPTPLIDMCEAILADGELSSDEVYRLSEFLNATPECTLHWPGKQLATLLVEVWKDGEISQEELQQVAELLMDIHAHYHEHLAKEHVEIPASLMPGSDIEEPDGFALPNLTFKTSITSFTTGQYEYEIDLKGPSCTCHDWESRRSELPEGHFGRCCKHIVSILNNVPFKGEAKPFIEAFASTGTTPHPKKDWVASLLDGQHVYVSSPAFEWSDILVQTNDGWQRYEYNVVESRWAYKKEPSQSEQILQILAQSYSLPEQNDN